MKMTHRLYGKPMMTKRELLFILTASVNAHSENQALYLLSTTSTFLYTITYFLQAFSGLISITLISFDQWFVPNIKIMNQQIDWQHILIPSYHLCEVYVRPYKRNGKTSILAPYQNYLLFIPKQFRT